VTAVTVPQVRVAHIDDIPPGKLLTREVDGSKVLLANVDGEIRAVRAECSHEGAPLGEGELDGATIECPWHFSRFCLRTGEALDPPAMDPVDVFTVDVRAGEIFVNRREMAQE
jgi:nitrite reductase/ring-hydroxylating ferredoxin subunit